MVRTWHALILVSMACAPEIGITVKDGNPEDPLTLIGVKPESIDFGRKTSLDVARETVTIINDGTTNLFVDRIQLKADGSFDLDLSSAALPLDLAAGEEATFEVVFTPVEGGQLEGSVTIGSDADNEPEVVVPFGGEGAVPELVISPDPMQFGDRFIPCGTQQAFLVQNVGFEPLVITSMALEGTTEQVALAQALPTFPITLRQGQTQVVPIRFDPAFPQTLAADLVVESNDLSGTGRAAVTGSARYATSTTDVFQVERPPEIDILFAVDQSCSMDTEAVLLGQEFGGFISILQSANVNWEVGVTTGASDGCFVNGIVSPSRPGWDGLVRSAVNYGDDSLPDTERLLQAVSKSIGRDSPGGCNQGFHTDGDPLQVIYVSDEVDQSSGHWSTYLASLQVYAGSSPLKAHAIVDVNRACGDNTGPGGYIEMAQNTGGRVLNVCSSWANQFASIAQAALNDLGFYEMSLSGADPNSIEVTINGTVVSTGWTFDRARNGIQFDDAVAAGSEIRVSYGVSPTCP